jgi:hypothetical protein
MTLKSFSTRTDSLRVDKTDPSNNVSRVVCYLGLVVETDTVFAHGFLLRRNTTWHRVWTAEKMPYDNFSLFRSFSFFPPGNCHFVIAFTIIIIKRCIVGVNSTSSCPSIESLPETVEFCDQSFIPAVSYLQIAVAAKSEI